MISDTDSDTLSASVSDMMSDISNQSMGALSLPPAQDNVSPDSDLGISGCGGFMPRTPVDKLAPAEGLILSGRVLGHTLNKDKQAAKMRADINKAHVAFESKNEGSDVIIECSSGFYEKVAKPTFCKLSPGYFFNHPSSSFELKKIEPTVDSSGTPEKTLFSFAFITMGVPCKITITLYHTTRTVHVQGSRIMPDGSKAAHWFVKHIMHIQFIELARVHKLKIDQFHAELLKMDTERIVVSSRASAEGPTCAVCFNVMRGTSKPRPCPSGSCQDMLHTGCVQKHKCAVPPLPQLSEGTAAAPGGATALQSLLAPLATAIAATQPSQVSPAITSSRKRSSADVSFLESEVTVLASSSPASIPLPMPSSSSVLTSTTSASQVVPAITFSSQTCSFSSVPLVSTLPPSTRPKVTQKPPPKKAKTLATTPDSVQNEFLNNELDLAKAKISSLESALLDRDNTIKLYAERLKSMEEVRFSTLSNQYLTKTPPSAQIRPQNSNPPPPSLPPQAASIHTQCSRSSVSPPSQCPGSDSMTAVKVELSQLREIVVSLQKSIRVMNSESTSSFTPTAEAGQHATRRTLLPTPAPNPWINGIPPIQQPARNNERFTHPRSNRDFMARAGASNPPPRPANQSKKAWSPSPASLHPNSHSFAGRSRNYQRQSHHPQQQHRQPGHPLGGVRLPLSATAAAKAHWMLHPLSERHQGLPPAGQPPQNQVPPQEQQPAAVVEVTIPVSNRFAPLSENLNI